MKRKIYAMAASRKDAMRQIQDVSLPLIEHLIKLYMFPNAGYKTHWSKEVRNFFNSAPKLKGSNKLLSYKNIRDAIALYEDQIDHLMKSVFTEYRQFEVERNDVAEAERMIGDYLDWACEQVAAHIVFNSFGVMSKLEEIGF